RNWKSAPTPRPDKMREWWREHPLASVILPTGKSFDVVDVPETAGCLALARLERSDVPLGPVAATPQRRMLFFVLPGATAKLADLVRKQGYVPSALDLQVHGEGGFIPAPPTRLGGLGSVQWARRPTVANSWLPDLEAVISPLAYACGRERRMR
ncbi:bifunctional DNA primase/polymerase, partial [Streptomyces sp. A7024]